MLQIYKTDKTLKPLGPNGFGGQTGMEPIEGLKMTFAMSLGPSIGWKRVPLSGFSGRKVTSLWAPASLFRLVAEDGHKERLY